MSELKNVAVAGATGSIGPYIVQALVKHGFNVTVLTRQASRAKFDPRVHIIPTDYSPESLKAALEGQDAVVAPFGFAGIALQPQLIEAAVLAGVKRFLPSEFGFSNAAVQSSALTPPPPNKITVMKLLEEKSKEIPEFSYTAVACGTFIDWVCLPLQEVS
jgi:NAD(P)-dependent dehydrogenase (short-subunit alcohol dehydrogenase family)